MGTLLLSLVTTALLLLGGPAQAAPGITLTISPSTVEVGESVLLKAVVSPKRRGRPVVFSQRRPGATWAKLGVSRTNRRGVATLRRAAGTAGAYEVRAVAKRYKGAKSVSTLARYDVVGATGTEGAGEDRSGPLGVTGPTRVTTGTVFDVVVDVNAADGPVGDATLRVASPLDGSQVTPPTDLEFVAGEATEPVGNVPAGERREFTLRWRAPAQPGTLSVEADLTWSGGPDSVELQIPVVDEPAGGGRFGAGLDSYGTSRSTPTAPDDVSSTLCTRLSDAPVPTFATAVSQARAYVDDQIVESRRDEWEQLPALDDPDRIDEVVMTAFADQRPAAALAASLRGHELRPQDPVHLTNAAVAANLLQRPEWAVAFAQHAGTLGLGVTVGTPQDAARLGTLGHAYLLLWRLPEAVSALRRGLLVDPHNAQLHQSLANALACKQDKAAALPHLRRGWRPSDDTPEIGGDDYPGQPSRAPSPLLFDLTGETPADALVMPSMPASFAQYVGRAPTGNGDSYYKSQLDLVNVRLEELRVRRVELQNQQNAARPHVQPAQWQRTYDVLERIGGNSDPEVEAARDAYLESTKRMFSWLRCHGMFPTNAYCAVDGDSETCSIALQVYGEWEARAKVAVERFEEFYDVAWPHMTALQANLTDPVAHELAAVKIEDHFLRYLSTLLSSINDSSRAMSDLNQFADDGPCAGPAPLDEPQQTVTVMGDEAPFCAPNSIETRLAAEIDLGIVKVKMSCEKVSVEAGLGAYGWLEAFAKFETPWTGNGATFYVGTKASVPNVGSFENAWYLQLDAKGRVADFGIEVGTETEGGAGAGPVQLKVTADSDKIRMSAMSTPVKT